MLRYAQWMLGLAILACFSSSHAEQGPRFGFRPREVLQYRVQQTTKVAQTLEGETQTFESSTELVKRWEILEVAPDETVTLQLSIPELKLQQKLPNGQTILYDSTRPENSHAALRQQMERFLGKPTVHLKLDPRGQVLKAQVLLSETPGQLAGEPPFAVILPQQPWQVQLRWIHPYTLVLEPPLGTGEKYEAERHFKVRALNQQQAEIVWITQIKNPPATSAEKIPLLQKLTRGVAWFDLASHRVTFVRIQAGGSVEGHEGPNSKYEFSSEYIERLVP